MIKTVDFKDVTKGNLHCKINEGNDRLFSLRDKILIFSVIAGGIWSGFCYRINIFTSKISNLLLLLGAWVTGVYESWYTLQIYLWYIYLTIYLSIFVVVDVVAFILFCASKELIHIQNPIGNCLFKVNNTNTRIRYEICSKLILLTLNIFHTLL